MRLDRIIFVLSSLGLAVPVAAQQRDGERASDAVNAVLECRKFTVSAERIACFDRTSLVLEAASKRTEIVLMDREDTAETRRAQFGFSPRRIRAFGLGDADDNEVTEVSSEVISLMSARYPNLRFRISDGSLWETTQGTRNSPPRVGEKVYIKRGPLGNYLASINGRISLRVMRVE